MAKNVAVRVENLTKVYRIGARASGKSVRTDLKNLARRASRRPLLPESSAEYISALNGVSFEVPEGHILGIIGKNGSGKSTLLKILARITKPTSGRAEIYGRLGALLEVGTGFHPDLTGRENIYMNGSILGMSRQDINARFDSIVEFSEVQKFIDTPVKHYSSGMYVRLAFAVGVHIDPDILVIDEVLAVGDAAFQRKSLDKMRQVALNGRTVLFVSHGIQTVKELCHSAILLQEGRIIAQGNTAEVARTYLGVDLQKRGEKVWKNVADAPGNEVVRLRAVRVVNAADPSLIQTDFTVREGVCIELEHEVFEGGYPLDASIYLYNELGECVFFTLDNLDSPWRDTTRPAGMYRSRCFIPPDLLNNGRYSVMTAVAEAKDKPRMHLEARDVIGFEVKDALDPEGVRGNFTYPWPPSVVRVRLNWDVDRVGESREAISVQPMLPQGKGG